MRTRCPSCKKSSDHAELQAGWTVVCLACGHPHVAEAIRPEHPETPERPHVPEHQESPTPATGTPVSQELWPNVLGDEPATPRTPKRLHAGIVIFAGCVLSLLIIGIGLAAYGMQQGWNLTPNKTVVLLPVAKPVLPKPHGVEPTSERRESVVPKSATQPASTPTMFMSPEPTTRSFARATLLPPSAIGASTKTQATTEPAKAPVDFAVLPVPRLSKPPMARPGLQPIAVAKSDLTDEQIGAAIQHGVDYMLRQFNARTGLLEDYALQNNSYALGADPLCVYALLQCSVATNDPRLDIHKPEMKGMIAALKGLPLQQYHWETYARALRASALAVYNRPEDKQTLSADFTSLLRGGHDGHYNYRVSSQPKAGAGFDGDPTRWDNSNSQYGLLGVWSGAETGREVPPKYWEDVRKHWEFGQLPTGEWAYAPGWSRSQSMTCAGLASLFVAHDYLEPARFTGAVGREPYSAAVSKGLAWLEAGDTSITYDHGGYSLFGIERVGLASGFKYFGDHDWYRELAKQLVNSQGRDGAWGGMYGPTIETPYSLLFLARGRHPILMNKLRTQGHWANRPRDVANLARFAAHELERPLNWQVVPLDRPFTDWMDSPILYLASEQPVEINERELQNIRDFINNGGMLFTQADGNSPAFTIFAKQLARRLFPDYEMQDLPDNHPVYDAMFHLQPVPGLKYVTNGSRVLMLHSTTDITSVWERRDYKFKPIPFQFGTNLFVFASGDQSLRNRLTSNYLPPVSRSSALNIKVARLNYPGNWDPEPAAWTRFSRWFSYQTGYGLSIDNVAMKDLRPGQADVAVLTGAQPYDLTDAESNAIKAFAEAGGVVLIDTCGGRAGFDHSIESSLLLKSFPNIRTLTVSGSHPLVNTGAPGMRAMGTPKLRSFTARSVGAGAEYLKEIPVGQGHILYTTIDYTSALLGTHTAGIVGYDPDYATGLLENVMLWTMDGQRDE